LFRSRRNAVLPWSAVGVDGSWGYRLFWWGWSTV